MEIQEWMLEAVEYYQRHGFFNEGTASFVLDELLAVYEARERRFGHKSATLDALWSNRELGLLQLDQERVLYLDFETPSVGGSTMYISTIPRLARITRGVFSAWDVQELALDDERWGPVLLTFRVGSERHEYEVRGGNSDWIDPQLLWIVDEFLRVSPYTLHVACDGLQGEQGGYFVALSADERDLIDTERGLAFVPLPDEPSAPWTWDVDALLSKARTPGTQPTAG
ncbi:MAG: hypothetical protein M3P18_11055 [Actinomycetota bacterium]|nr:hypothetical protein [Actinomycetota bacterium]